MNVGAWTDDHLYLRSVEGENKEKRSKLHFVQLETGLSTTINKVFNGNIRDLKICSDNHLYMCLARCTKFVKALPICTDTISLDVLMPGYLEMIQYFRMPIK